jgi:hypothetical protein
LRFNDTLFRVVTDALSCEMLVDRLVKDALIEGLTCVIVVKDTFTRSNAPETSYSFSSTSNIRLLLDLR